MNNKDCRHEPHGHPCFDSGSHGSVGRIHLPVAPRCNIKCRFCSRKHDCAAENRPGVTSRVISPAEALERLELAQEIDPRIRVAGIAGPGDPLANEATFETMALVRKAFPHVSLCLSTNGLLLPERLDDLLALGLDSLTVTVNSLNEATGARIYDFVHHRGVTLRGAEAARRLRDNQVTGIRRAAEAGIRVKVNAVLLPGINEHEMLPLAQALREMNVAMMNIMPLIPQADFAQLQPVPPVIHRKIQQECGLFIDQITHCRQCRADACGVPGTEPAKAPVARRICNLTVTGV